MELVCDDSHVKRLRAPSPMLLAVVAVVAVSLVGYIALFPARFCDFRAFYCSGRAVITGRDPYREHPLHECEHAVSPRFVSYLPDNITIPAPFPGYALAVFAVVDRLPFDCAIAIWTSGALLALGSAILLVARLTAAPLTATVIVLAVPAAIVSLPLGQATPFVLLAIALCARLLCDDRPRRAALCALAAAIEPHVALALGLGLFVAAPRSRSILLAGAVALPALGIVMFGPRQEWEYFRDVLPAHALVNVPEFSQFSTANLAFMAGMSPQHAVSLGNVWYAVSIVIGVVAGRRLQSRLGPAAVAFVPVAFAVFGGTHTHMQQLSLAVPAFLLITSTVAGRRRNACVSATFTASIPWLLVAPFPLLYPSIVVIAVAFARVMRTARIGPALGTLSLIGLLLLCTAVVTSHVINTPFASSRIGNPLAEVAWGHFVAATSVPVRAWYLLGKVPTLLAFAVMLSVVLKAAATPLSPTS